MGKTNSGGKREVRHWPINFFEEIIMTFEKISFAGETAVG
ncbi:hypothetical protein ALO91_102909 [Pseudomonas syringae pv. aceris]|uniref:Uncharacterized protein n=1 Tax=Pseudomonas syringae pv. aceris TaxID=199198 RepID=A0A0L8ING1_PSESX|nr:hypothetical protein PSYAR_19491 [Pseudomonas syringae pv. aceris str. M302273]KOG02978.1 Uncharacterized protein ABJ98_2004 [Pseudomonas syringae pv. aceris]KPW12922.1 hypothetical protein ALO91_102909 [Pseudomonas syringae pv. aceris]